MNRPHNGSSALPAVRAPAVTAPGGFPRPLLPATLTGAAGAGAGFSNWAPSLDQLVSSPWDTGYKCMFSGPMYVL